MGANRRTDLTKRIVAFHNFAYAHKNWFTGKQYIQMRRTSASDTPLSLLKTDGVAAQTDTTVTLRLHSPTFQAATWNLHSDNADTCGRVWLREHELPSRTDTHRRVASWFKRQVYWLVFRRNKVRIQAGTLEIFRGCSQPSSANVGAASGHYGTLPRPF